MLPISTIVRALRANQAEFSRLFVLAQQQTEIVPDEPQQFEAVARNLAGAEAFAEALRFAQARGFLDPLVDLIIDEGLADGTLTRALVAAQVRRGNAPLQAMANPPAGFAQPHVAWRGIGDGIRWTGKVFVDGTPKGTGILVGADLVLTAWHVVRDLYDRPPGGPMRPRPGAARRLAVEFDDFLKLIGRGGGFRPAGSLTVNAAEDWNVIASCCHDDELHDRLPGDLTQLQGCWDYAVIRLAGAPGLQRRWVSFDAHSVVPRSNERILLFQHPAGQQLKYDENFIAAADAQVRVAVPTIRFLHYANTVGGSSGGPCFDKRFTFFGVHQGAWEGQGQPGRVVNRGVPIVRIREHIDQEIGGLPPLDPAKNPVWNLGAAYGAAPVIGTEEFQSVIWRAAGAGAPRIVVISGDEKRGKTFRVTLLDALLAAGGHLKVILNAGAIAALGAADLAAKICADAGAVDPGITPLSEVNSTVAAWLRDEVATKTLAALDAVRNNRLVWLAITDLNQFEVHDPNAAQFLLLLCERVLTHDWLRIVLDGMRGDLPRSLRAQTVLHRAGELQQGEIAAYFQRLAAENNFAIDDLSRAATASFLLTRYHSQRNRDLDSAFRTLVDELLAVSDAYLVASEAD